ncbi:MAG TPA: hypothetical protein VNI55_01200, partial [Gaiellaceae bacterium]|nr:hypothetical protein [Gaiellaceae bacterium]
VATDPAWAAFADETGCLDVWPDPFASILSGMSGASVVETWRGVLASVRERQSSASFDIRCDGPTIRRLLSLALFALADGSVAFRSETVKTEMRSPIALLDVTEERDASETVRMCSWCCRIDAEGWAEAEDAVHRLELFARELTPEITHTICETCAAKVECTLALDPVRV